MSSTPYEHIATVQKAVGTNGEVAVLLTDNLFSLLKPSTKVWLTPPPRTGVYETTVSSIRRLDARMCAVSFTDVHTKPDALDIVGRKILVEVPIDFTFSQAISFKDSLLGRKIVDAEHGELGSITDILETGANDVWTVSGRFGEFMIPVIESVVLKIPRASNKPIKVKLIKGLLDQ